MSIDIEAYIFDRCARAVIEKYPDAFTTSEYVSAPASFPSVSIMEANNVTDTSRNDSSLEENASIVTFDVKVFSNLRHGAKRQAKDIAQIIDGVLQPLNFNRVSMVMSSNPSQSSVFSISARYVASVSKDGIISRR